ncbi:hypothetical protein [Kocuria carniphila]|uniref:hypothetical protein n=1 Tax=Kocuria carniphila TaxID=262208 RepID=UPI0034CE08C5
MSSSANTTARGSAERLFHVPQAHRKAALAWLDRGVGIHGSAPRHASSVVVVRDGDHGVEALMMFRPDRPSFGQLSFPGGLLEPSDDEPLIWSGPRPTEWANKLGSDDIGLARRAVVAAARRVFVETGLLFAGSEGDGIAEHVDGADWMLARQQLSDLDISFAGVLSNRVFAFRTELLRPLARWMTSDFVHQRVDLRYFAAVLPVGQRCSPLKTRARDSWLGWVDAATLLEHPHDTAVPALFADRNAQHRESGQEFNLGEVATPGVQTILGMIARANSAIAFLSARRDMTVQTPSLDVRNGDPVLVLNN